jgi:hypothetical protein
MPTSTYSHLPAVVRFPGIGHYGCLPIGRADYLNHRFRERVETLTEGGDIKEEIPAFREALTGLSPDIRSDYVLIGCMLRQNLIAEAISSLDDVIERYPDEKAPRSYRDKLLHLKPA